MQKTLQLNLGCGPLPLHQQHLTVMGGDLRDWILVDKYVTHPMIKNWDATTLEEVEDESVSHIYASHLLEHISHTKTDEVLKLWQRKLIPGGKLTINVPDLVWACSKLLKLESGQMLDGYYYQFQGEHGLQSVFYGSQSHEGEHHHAGFTETSLFTTLDDLGFVNIAVTAEMDAHDMGVVIATARKREE